MNNVKTILLRNNSGMSVEVCNFGARITSIKFPINGEATEMTVAYQNAEDYLDDSFYLGATCGRVCNRISNAQFDLNGKTYQLTKNDAENCLHGGVENFARKYWSIDSDPVSTKQVTLSLTSIDGDQGFPGTLQISVQYQLTEENELIVNYLAKSDAATPINLTNHTYFNLGEATCEALMVQINASHYLERNQLNTPTGNIISVTNNDYDFRQQVSIGVRQANTNDQELALMQGYDHCFVLDDSAIASEKAVILSLQNNVKMTMYTDQPAMQLYTGSYLSGEFKRYQGLCLEAQNYPDAVNFNHFPSSILPPNELYKREIRFKFSNV
ncbi:aldose epimerase family protein [Thalassotalea psychrophila]|uniref:Aldose 1-epimerase n=1 Tax=Thalassotalea psychrophila TaxID=3065647 RepID=A0ABY9TSH4_9GAMM|nr:aldose epimerase family protein [Colwelliaceae bacterium SQ149]